MIEKEEIDPTLIYPEGTDNFDRQYYGSKYQAECECGQVHTIYTQQDDNPEYRQIVFVRCACNRAVQFVVPVN